MNYESKGPYDMCREQENWFSENKIKSLHLNLITLICGGVNKNCVAEKVTLVRKEESL